MNFPDNGPIIACSTSTNSNAAIAVLRFSGFKNLDIFKKFISLKTSKIKSRYAHLVNIIEGSDKVLDQALLLFFEGPNSFTGENCLELHIHGNLLNIRQLLELFTKNDEFRAAKEGEFTYRALMNRKLSLSQVEGLDLMLNANSTLMLQKGLDVLHGDLHKMYKELHSNFMSVKSAVEMNVDFSEDIGEEEAQELFKVACFNFKKTINTLYSKTQVNMQSLLSPSVVLVGGTNAGKSSIFNEILDESRSIVSPMAGTTRDFVSEYVYLDGTNFKIVDTAGIRITKDLIEEEGIKRALKILKNSFYKIIVINPFCYNKDDYFIDEEEVDLVIVTHCDLNNYEEKLKEISLPIKTKNLLFTTLSDNIEYTGKVGPIGPEIYNRSDRTSETSSGPIGPKKEDWSHGTNQKIDGPIGPKDANWSHRTSQNIDGPIGPKDENWSHRTGENIDGPIGPNSNLLKLYSESMVFKNRDVAEKVSKKIVSKYLNLMKSDPIPIERHCNTINKIFNSYKEFEAQSNTLCDFGILSSEVNILEVQVSELIGITPVEDVLNNIFSNFCIGK